MRRRNKYHPLNVRPMIKDERLFQKFACVARQRSFGRRRGKKIAPDFVTSICDHQSTNHSAHAVADEHNRFLLWERALDPIEILAEERGRVGIRITTRITEVPELIMLPYRWVMTEGVDHWGPARSCFLQAVNENHGRPRGIELLQPSQHRCICIGSRVHDTREAKPFGTFTSNQECRRRIKIGGKWKNLFVQRDSFSA